jgi:hypothetical protein
MALTKITDPVLIRNFTPVADILPGTVLISGKRPEISTVRAFAGEKNVGVGYFGGEYEGIADGSIAAGDSVYYNMATGKVTKTVTGAYHLGYCLFAPAGCTNGSTVRILHAPNGTQLGDGVITPQEAVTLTAEAVTDSTSGTAANAVVAPASTDYTAAELTANFATLATVLNKAITDIGAITTALTAAGILEEAEAEGDG